MPVPPAEERPRSAAAVQPADLTGVPRVERSASILARGWRVVDPLGPPPAASNAIHTTKYSLLSFLPRCLFLEFRRAANMYFLVIAVLQSIPLVSPLTPVTAIAPLVFVIAISLLREAVEDSRRRASDRVANALPVRILRAFEPMTVESAAVRVGDVLRVSDKETVAADAVLLASSEPDGSCFLDTSNLDGEANLKTREALRVTQGLLAHRLADGGDGASNSRSEPSSPSQPRAASAHADAAADRGTDRADPEPPRLVVQCEDPDQELYRFAGHLSLRGRPHSLSEPQFLPRGSRLMNTRSVLALVVYTGHETKVMKNARPSRHKTSRVDALTSRTVVGVFALQLLLCAGAAGGHAALSATATAEDAGGRQEAGADAAVVLLSYVVLLNTLIPISLVVTVELVKTAHARFIQWDALMRDARSGAGAVAHTSALTDALGQVRVLFTDKTGTLTQNSMVFRKCSVGGNVYAVPSSSPASDSASRLGPGLDVGLGSTPSSRVNSGRGGVPASDAPPTERMDVRSVGVFRGILRNLEARESRLALAMALCHTVVCERVDASESGGKAGIGTGTGAAAGTGTGTGTGVRAAMGTGVAAADALAGLMAGDVRYNADSPDECALVQGAAAMGVRLLARERNAQLLVAVTDESQSLGGARRATTTYALGFALLRVLPFSSDRRRMGVVLRDDAGRLRLLCKGADSVILERCEAFASPRAETMAHVDQFASEGLRTLLFAERELDERYFEDWQARFQDAELDMSSKEERTATLMDELEQRLTLLGASAVEDKLQEGVPETIALFQKAGIKIWVLTGDKLETALEMGKLCQVVAPGMKEVLLSATSRELMGRAIDAALADAQGELAVVLDGPALTLALLPANRARFLALTERAATVLVCRSSPLQKALAVELVKASVPGVTLAVGDGANDVSMIRAAHVGVGIAGQEGMQAVRSADFAVQQFRHLERLLLHHGRLSYLRTSQCINYFFYKNALFTLPQLVYSGANLFSAQTFYSDLYITAYNVVFTAWPVLARAVTEVDVSPAVAARFPQLYRAGALDVYLSQRSLAGAFALGAAHAVLLTTMPLLQLEDSGALSRAGATGGLHATGVASFLGVVAVAHLQIFVETWSWSRLIAATYTSSLLVSAACVAALDRVAGPLQGVAPAVLALPRYWLTLLWVSAACMLPWLAIKCWEENFGTPTPVHVLRRMRQGNKVLDAAAADESSRDMARRPEPVGRLETR